MDYTSLDNSHLLSEYHNKTTDLLIGGDPMDTSELLEAARETAIDLLVTSGYDPGDIDMSGSVTIEDDTQTLLTLALLRAPLLLDTVRELIDNRP